MSSLYIGLISGTSMDGVDCALIDGSGKLPKVLKLLSKPMPADLQQTLLTLCSNQQVSLRQLGSTDVAVGRLFAETVLELLSQAGVAASDVRAIGSHGQTIWHEPPQDASGYPFTLQIGDPNTIAELTGITTVADLRRRDMAAGGQGAPIVPALHRELFRSTEHNRIVLNLGGIANITWLPKDDQGVLGMDTGPASVLMDGWIQKQRSLPYDAEGSWASSAMVDESLLQLLLEEPYFVRPAPKSTGRELFNLAWLESKLARLRRAGRNLPAGAVQASLLALSVETISREIEQLATEGEIIVCGGGAHNRAMLQLLAARLPGFQVETSASHGLDPDYVEAVAFAWFASRTMNGQTIGFDAFTGASHPVLAGGIYPVLQQVQPVTQAEETAAQPAAQVEESTVQPAVQPAAAAKSEQQQELELGDVPATAAPAKNAAIKNAPAEHVTPKQRVTPKKKAAAKKPVAKKTAEKAVVAEEQALADNASAKSAPAKKAAVKKATAKKAATKTRTAETPAKTPVKKAPAPAPEKSAPEKKAPVKKASPKKAASAKAKEKAKPKPTSAAEPKQD